MNEISDIIINSKKELTVTGVKGIVNFSDTEAVLSTDLGYLAVTGNGFIISSFDKENGKVMISGNITAVFYPGGKSEKRGLFSKMFGK